MRTKLAALITATAVAVAPVSIANAQDISSEISDTLEQSSQPPLKMVPAPLPCQPSEWVTPLSRTSSSML